MFVCELIFKLSDLTGIKQKKSTENNEFYSLFIPIIFKNFMKLSIFRFYMTIETKTNIYSRK
jgi:surfactin synthase thioesterase subunit